MRIRPAPGARRAIVTLAAVFLWLAATAWYRRFTAPDEGRYAGVAFEMLRSADWLVPRLDGLPFFHKPPLFYWMSAAAMSVFGVSEWPARLPSILGATGAAGALYLFAARWANVRQALIATTVLVTLPYFYIGAQFANMDMLVAGCMAMTILLAAHATLVQEQGGAWRRWLASAFTAAALGLLAKGLIGLVLPGAIFVAWCAVSRRTRALRMFAWWPGWCLLLAIAAPWFVAMQLRYPGFYDYFIVTQHFRRFAATGFNNAYPFWFYIPVIAALTLPWIGWIGWMAFDWRRSTAPSRFSDVDWLMLVWLVVVVVFFSIPRSKLIGYVLPALPPLAWFIGRAVQDWMASRPARGWRPGGTAWVAAALCVAAVVAADRLGTPPGARLKLPAGARIADTDQVVMLDTYYYEIPFYWKLRQRVLILSDWQDPELPKHDNWRNELVDAGRFEPATGAETLIGSTRLATLLCAPRRTWLIGLSSSALAAPWLADPRFVLVAYNREAAVWRFDGLPDGSGACPVPSPGVRLHAEGLS